MKALKRLEIKAAYDPKKAYKEAKDYIRDINEAIIGIERLVEEGTDNVPFSINTSRVIKGIEFIDGKVEILERALEYFFTKQLLGK